MRALLCAAILLAPTLLGSAGAECARDATLYSRRPTPVGWLDPAQAGATHGTCAVVAGQTIADDRHLYPGATEVRVHGLVDHGAGNATVPVTLDGLGLANATVPMVRTIGLGPPGREDVTYWSAWIALGDPDATGDLFVSIAWPDGSFVNKTYTKLA